jgi:hypothetical protein
MIVSFLLSENNLNSNKNFLEYIEKILSASSTPRLDIKIAMFFTPYKLSPADEKILWRIMNLPITHFDFNSHCPSKENQNDQLDSFFQSLIGKETLKEVNVKFRKYALKYKYLNIHAQDEEYLGDIKNTLYKVIYDNFIDTQYMKEKDEIKILKND